VDSGLNYQQQQDQLGQAKGACKPESEEEEEEDYWGDGSAADPLGDGEECWRLGGESGWGGETLPPSVPPSPPTAGAGDVDISGKADAVVEDDWGDLERRSSTGSCGCGQGCREEFGGCGGCTDNEDDDDDDDHVMGGEREAGKEGREVVGQKGGGDCVRDGVMGQQEQGKLKPQQHQMERREEEHFGEHQKQESHKEEDPPQVPQEHKGEQRELENAAQHTAAQQGVGQGESHEEQEVQQQQHLQLQEEQGEEGELGKKEEQQQQLQEQGGEREQQQAGEEEEGGEGDPVGRKQRQQQAHEQGHEKEQQQLQEEEGEGQSSLKAAAALVEASLHAGDYADALRVARAAVQTFPAGAEVPLLMQQLLALAAVLHYSQSNSWQEVLQQGQVLGQSSQPSHLPAVTDVKVLRQRYKRLAGLIHPDKCSCSAAEAGFKALSQAYEQGLADLGGKAGEAGGDEGENEGGEGGVGRGGDWWSPWAGEGEATGGGTTAAGGGGGGGNTVPGTGAEEAELWQISMQVRGPTPLSRVGDRLTQ
jgi:hypothetical protein